MTELSRFHVCGIGLCPTHVAIPAPIHRRVPRPVSRMAIVVAMLVYFDEDDERDRWLEDVLGYLWRSHVVQRLGFSEFDAAAYLATPYGSQGDIAKVLGRSQSTISRAQQRVRRALLDEGWDFDYAPKEGRRSLARPRLAA